MIRSIIIEDKKKLASLILGIIIPFIIFILIGGYLIKNNPETLGQKKYDELNLEYKKTMENYNKLEKEFELFKEEKLEK
jgi:hypothetical protein